MEEAKEKWILTVFVFSGRKNPSWKIPEKQSNEWMALWQKAPSSDKDAKQPSLLGYTGCKLQFNEHSHWFVYNGCVSFYDNGKIISKKDEGSKLENFLLNTATRESKKILQDLNLI